MCHQRIEKHLCAHTTRYKPHFCRYRFNINHQIEPRFVYSQEPCKECLAGNVKQPGPDKSASSCRNNVVSESKKTVREGIYADESGEGVRRGDSHTGKRTGEGESEWKRKLRNKLVKGKGNGELVKGSMMSGEVGEEESEWKRKLRGRLKRGGGYEEVLKGSLLT
jgi:hypothetical protein